MRLSKICHNLIEKNVLFKEQIYDICQRKLYNGKGTVYIEGYQ